MARRTSDDVRLAVLSDVHLDRTEAPASADRLIALLDRAASIEADHVVIAGDLFDSAGALDDDGPWLRRELRARGLWDAERLTIVPGNHDVHAGGHHRKLDGVVSILDDGNDAHRERFTAWVAPLFPRETRIRRVEVYPAQKRIGNVRLIAMDSTRSKFVHSSSGRFSEETDAHLREAIDEGYERRVLVCHHPPSVDPLLTAAEVWGFMPDVRKAKLAVLRPRGFSPRSRRRLEAFVRDAAIDAFVCGHVHAARAWRFAGARVFREGRGGTRASAFGLLRVPAAGAPTYATVVV